MYICTISNDAWLNNHTARWLRYARGSNPDAKLCLLYCGEQNENHPILNGFDVVEAFDKANDQREWYNEVRMSAPSIFGVDEILYCDADADIIRDMAVVPLFSDKKLMWVRSPGVTQEWKEICAKEGWQDWGANNGLLYLRKDWGNEYHVWIERLKANGANPRMLGTYAFNALIREYKDENVGLPYETSVIWWDYASPAYLNSKCIQWCNNQGQAHRLALEQEWRNAVT